MEDSQIERIQFLNVPVDCVDQEKALKRIERLLLDRERHQITFLSRRNLFKARRNSEFRRCLRESSLVLPVSGSIVRGAEFLRGRNLTRFEPFSFVIRLLSLAERLGRTLYLLGARKDELEKTEKNLRDSFPGLRMVGRFSGFFPRDMEKNVLLAIKKASPSFLLVGNGPVAKELWILRHKKDFQAGISIWIGECFDFFSGKKKYSPHSALYSLFKKPWKIFSFFYFWIITLIHKLFRL